jgi:gliding motility-associated-like protein
MMLVVQDSFCSDTSAHKIVVEDFILELTSNEMHFDNRLDPLTLTSYGSPSPYYITAWRPAHLFPDQSAWQQTLPADSSRTYTILGETPLGCIDSASVSVTVSPAIHIPNSFTPNNDGLNDVFRVGSYGDIINVKRFDIYDRWGKKVWDGRSSTNSRSWDGTYNGTPAETGTYYYIIEAENLQGERYNQKGDVLLLR